MSDTPGKPFNLQDAWGKYAGMLRRAQSGDPLPAVSSDAACSAADLYAYMKEFLEKGCDFTMSGNSGSSLFGYMASRIPEFLSLHFGEKEDEGTTWKRIMLSAADGRQVGYDVGLFLEFSFEENRFRIFHGNHNGEGNYTGTFYEPEILGRHNTEDTAAAFIRHVLDQKHFWPFTEIFRAMRDEALQEQALEQGSP